MLDDFVIDKKFRLMYKEKTGREAIKTKSVINPEYVEFIERELQERDAEDVKKRIPFQEKAFDELIQKCVRKHGVSLTLFKIWNAVIIRQAELEAENKYPRKLKRIKKIAKIISKATDKICRWEMM